MRKAIGKKQRFDIFKRDGFTCSYCGAHPPLVVLEVDHIVAVADGGDNDTDNLTTSCFDCNRGKGASSLQVIPTTLAEKAEIVREREEQLRGYNAVLMAARDRLEDDTWQVFRHWRDQSETTHAKFSSAKKFVEILGLPEVLDAVDITCARQRTEAAEWKYFCGVCWEKIRRAGL